MSDKSFIQKVLSISIPVALQSMLQSSFSMVDQIMVGQLGEKSVAAVEIAGRPGFIYSFIIGAISTITGIDARYLGMPSQAYQIGEYPVDGGVRVSSDGGSKMTVISKG